MSFQYYQSLHRPMVELYIPDGHQPDLCRLWMQSGNYHLGQLDFLGNLSGRDLSGSDAMDLYYFRCKIKLARVVNFRRSSSFLNSLWNSKCYRIDIAVQR